MLNRIAKPAIEFVFRHFRGVVATVSGIALWVVLVWALWLGRNAAPPALATAGLPLICLLTAVAMRVERRPHRFVASVKLRRILGPAARLWTGLAFAAAFATGALGMVTGLWLAAQTLLGALAVQAGPVAAIDGAPGETLDPVFRALATAAMLVAGLAIGYGYTIGQRRLQVTRATLPIRHLRGAPGGLRIVHVSDIHIGPYLSLARLADYVARINALEPDLICITGDIVDHRLRDLDPALPLLARLRARHGVIAILGNHDARVGADAVAARLQHGTDFVVLRDASHTINTPGGRFHILGLEDHGGAVYRATDEDTRLRALLATMPAGEPVVLLAHRPNVFDFAAAAGVGLTLSGHTHGGQIALGLGRGRVLSFGNFMTRFTRGLFVRDGSYLYVTHGLGVVGQPVRLGALREIVVLELVPANANTVSAAG
jgi:hypothetical protein